MPNGNNLTTFLLVGGGVAALAFLMSRRTEAAGPQIGEDERIVVEREITNNPSVELSNLRIPEANLFRMTVRNVSEEENAFYIRGFASIVEGPISSNNDVLRGRNTQLLNPEEFIFQNAAAFILSPGEILNIDFSLPQINSPGVYDVAFIAGEFDDTASNPFLTEEFEIIASNNFEIQ